MGGSTPLLHLRKQPKQPGAHGSPWLPTFALGPNFFWRTAACGAPSLFDSTLRMNLFLYGFGDV